MDVPNINSWVTVCSVLLRGMLKAGGGGGGSSGCMAFSIPSHSVSTRSLSLSLFLSVLVFFLPLSHTCHQSPLTSFLQDVAIRNELESLNRRRAFRSTPISASRLSRETSLSRSVYSAYAHTCVRSARVLAANVRT